MLEERLPTLNEETARHLEEEARIVRGSQVEQNEKEDRKLSGLYAEMAQARRQFRSDYENEEWIAARRADFGVMTVGPADLARRFRDHVREQPEVR